MRFDWPLGLLALLLVPLVVLAYLAIERRRARYAIHYTNIEVLASVTGRSPRWRSIVPPLVALLALICALAALARPEVRMSVASEQASIALTVDTSGSMAADDVKPTRLGAAEGAIRRFLDEIPKKYRVGLVTFSSEPFVVSPLTFDRQRLLSALQYDLVPGQGTAIGDALARSVELLQPVAADGEPVPRGPDGARRRPEQAAVRDPAALGRRPDARDAAAAAGRSAREVVRDPHLHGRARHAERRPSTAAGSRDRSRRIRPRCARSR